MQRKFAGYEYESFMLRITFLFIGQFALFEGFQDWNRGRADIHPEVAVLTTLLYGVSLAIILMSLMPTPTIMKFKDFSLIPILLSVITSVYVVAEIAYKGSYRTDVLAFSQYAAILAAKGLNPYHQDLTPALSMFGVQPSDLTPLNSGSYVSTFQYPSLQFLIFVPFVVAGLWDMRWVLVAVEFIIILVLYFKAPANLRPLVLIPLFAGSDLMINFTASSVSDILWVLPLIVTAFTLEERPILAGFFYGVACAFKQPPWLLAPFLVVYLCKLVSEDRASKLRRVVRFLLPALSVFAILNLPFAYGDIGGWLGNILTPISSNFVMLSQGPAVLSEVGLLGVGRLFYTILAVGVFVVLLANYYVYFDKLRYVVWIFPGIILWFSFRALTSYLVYWMPLMVASLILWYQAQQVPSTRERPL